VLGRERLDLAAIKQARERHLSRAAPHFDHATGGHDGTHAALQRARMDRPDSAVIAFGLDQRAGVVDQLLRRVRRAAGAQRRATPARSSSVSAAASSSAVSAP
jgi:hypothetical protein